MKIFNMIFFLVILLPCVLFFYPCGYFLLKTDPNYKAPIPTGSINYNGIGGYLINLDRSPDRYNYIKPYIDGLKIPVQRISAVDGALLSDQEIKQSIDLVAYKKLVSNTIKLGTIGCSLSHIKTWQTFLNSNYEFALIIEDDVSFDPEKLQLVIQELLENKQLWDINSFQIHHRGYPLTIKELSSKHKLALYLFKVTNAGAYIINRKAAEKLLEKALPIKMPIDWYFTRSWELDLKFTGIENPRIVAQTFGTSDINKTNQLDEENNNLLDKTKKFIYNLQTDVIRYLYNFNLYINQAKS